LLRSFQCLPARTSSQYLHLVRGRLLGGVFLRRRAQKFLNFECRQRPGPREGGTISAAASPRPRHRPWRAAPLHWARPSQCPRMPLALAERGDQTARLSYRPTPGATRRAIVQPRQPPFSSMASENLNLKRGRKGLLRVCSDYQDKPSKRVCVMPEVWHGLYAVYGATAVARKREYLQRALSSQRTETEIERRTRERQRTRTPETDPSKLWRIRQSNWI